MTVHLGLLALTIAIATGAFVRLRRRPRVGEALLLLLAVFAAAAEAGLWARESRLDARWEETAVEQLGERAERIVAFLREKGSTALDEIRAVGGDPDTQTLLSSEEQLARTARRPVFLDLLDRFPRTGPGGVTVYDVRGAPRAWSGWSPTATMSLNREPSRDADVVQIRPGNIYTLLEATHPIRDSGGRVVGWVVYQEPLRVQFPLQNRLLRVDDVLRRLEGGGGVRADVTLELSVAAGDDLRSIRPGPLKRNVQPDVASATAAIVTAEGGTVGRVSLSGLSRATTVREQVSRWATARAWLVLATLALAAAHAWFLAGGDGLRLRTRPHGLLTLLARGLLVAGARTGLLAWSPREALDPLGVFDPSWFASIRYGGLLRSPGDLLLTAAALLLVGRELRHFLAGHDESLRAFARRHPILAFGPGAFGVLLVGSIVGLHWTRVTDIARNANVPLFGGLDPFTSAPVAALELALLLGGVAFLLWGDALVRLGLSLFDRMPSRGAGLLVAALALLGSAVKMGDPQLVAAGDVLRPLPALAALGLFHRAADRWRRPGAGAILVASLLAALTNFAPLFDGIEARRRELVELFALEHAESPSNSRHFLLESTLDYLTRSEDLVDALERETDPEQANLAFILWAKSPLANVAAGCHLRLLGRDGRPFSTFSLGYPPELRDPWSGAGGGETRFRREEIGSTRVDLYSARTPLRRGDRRLGTLELSMAYYDDLRRPGAGRALPAVLTNLSAPEEFLRFTREVPDRIDRYRGEVLVSSTDPEGGLGKRVPPIIVQTLAGSDGGRWIERRMGGRRYDLYCVRERDGEVTVGYLTFGIERHGWLAGGSLLARSALVTLVIAVGAIAFLMLFSWVAPEPRRLDVPRLGFRERVIGGFLFVSLLPTVFLGVAGRGLFVQEKRKEFQERLEEDLRVSRELLGRRLSDAARNAAGSEEVRALFREVGDYRALSTPASVDGIVAVEESGRLLGGSPAADLGIALIPGELPADGAAIEFFRRRGRQLFACAVVPIEAGEGSVLPRGGKVLAFQSVDPVLAAELERRVGSSVSFFTQGLLSATSKPELYQSEILSDLLESVAYLKIELEGARRTLLESRVGATSFLSSYAPLADERGEPVGVLATLAPFHGGGLDLDASLVLSRIYFLCLLVFTGAIAAAVVLANRLTRPITDLTIGAERIGAGTLGHRIATKASGEIGALVRSFNSMSERLAASEVRDRERREYIEAIIRHVASGVISFDAGGRVATVNEAAARILETDPAALVGSRLDEIRGGEALSALLAAVEPVVAGGRTEVVHEVEVAGDDDESRTIRLVGTPLLGRDGQPQGAVVVFEDLSELIRSKKIKAWAEMARQVAHEIKNPLTPMKLSAQHLRQAWRDKHPKFDRILEESTETIVDRCEALRRIAIEFSDYARMPGRKIRREDLGKVLREARRLYGDAHDREVAFTLDAPENVLWTRIDKDEVMRLFINLFENSIQAMPDGGDLAVTARGENGTARVTISDSGQGIPREYLSRIFEPSFSTKTGGAGLGLPICKAIMEDYGGSIDIASEIGKGTTVTLVFPAEEA